VEWWGACVESKGEETYDLRPKGLGELSPVIHRATLRLVRNSAHPDE
jgi:hypothetical protein